MKVYIGTGEPSIELGSLTYAMYQFASWGKGFSVSFWAPSGKNPKAQQIAGQILCLLI